MEFVFEVEEVKGAAVVGGKVEFAVVSEVVLAVVVLVVDVSVVVGSWALQSTYSGQLQMSILESKYKPAGHDISTGLRSTHS